MASGVKRAEDFSRIRFSHIDNVVRNLDIATKTLRMCLILPRMAGDIKNVKERLLGTKYAPAIKYLEELKKMDMAKMQVFNHDIIKTIDYFLLNYEMQEKFPWYLNTLRPDERAVLFAFESIVEVAKRHLWRTSKVEVNMERQLYAKYQDREKIKESVELARKKLKRQTAVRRWKQAAKRLIADKMEADLALRKLQNNVFIENKLELCNRKVRDTHRNNVQKLKDLEEELEKARNELDKVLTNNARREKEHRAEKNKLLIQLESLLQKYDSSVKEKICENILLQDEYKIAQKELNDFMVTYRKEEAIYKRIVVKYEEEERRKQRQRVMLFMLNRAARKIQRYWQKWRQHMKKKARKAEKSKKK